MYSGFLHVDGMVKVIESVLVYILNLHSLFYANKSQNYKKNREDRTTEKSKDVPPSISFHDLIFFLLYFTLLCFSLRNFDSIFALLLTKRNVICLKMYVSVSSSLEPLAIFFSNRSVIVIQSRLMQFI